MTDYLVKRLLLIVPTLLIVSVIIFGTLRFIPGSVIDLIVTQMSEETSLDEVTIESIRHELGLDVPIHVQYGRWLAGIFRGDLGRSMWTDRPVMEEFAGRIPVTFELGFLAILIGLTISLPVGVLSAIRQDTVIDYVGRSIAIAGLSIPNFWLATMVMIFPAIWWNWSPPMAYIPLAEDPLANLAQFILPAIIMGTAMAAGTMRMTRTMVLEVLRQDYIRTAWSKGLRERVVVTRHVLRNAMIPVVTIMGLQLPLLIGGTVIMEQIFALPGIGLLMINAINTRDYPVISGINLLVATVVLVANLLTDLTYAQLDPRIRYR